jgi:hypothetical protein
MDVKEAAYRHPDLEGRTTKAPNNAVQFLRMADRFIRQCVNAFKYVEADRGVLLSRSMELGELTRSRRVHVSAIGWATGKTARRRRGAFDEFKAITKYL